MPRSRLAVATFFLPLVLAAQAPPRPARVLPYPIDLPERFQAAIDAGTRTANGHPGPKHWTNYARYRLAVDSIRWQRG
ncbi:MAG: hypothetical protein WAT39_26415 [Planctomycetota bacterium]